MPWKNVESKLNIDGFLSVRMKLFLAGLAQLKKSRQKSKPSRSKEVCWMRANSKGRRVPQSLQYQHWCFSKFFISYCWQDRELWEG